MPSNDRRDRAVAELEEATRTWIDAEKKRINNEVTYLKAVHEGTTGSSTLTRKNAEKAKIFLEEELASFLLE
jgi:hypothetical protein